MHGFKHRLRFSKTGRLRLLSHLDLLRSLERLCRRAEVPFKLTQGFHPSPKISLALALPLGVDGLSEVMEIELTEEHDSEAVLKRLNAHSPDGLQFESAYAIPIETQAMVRRSVYRLAVTDTQAEKLSNTIPLLLDQARVWAPRLKPRPRQVNIKPYLRSIHIEDAAVLLDLWVTPYGTARADELIALLGLPSPIDTGADLARIELELHDEVYDGLTEAPPEGTPELKPLEPTVRLPRAEPEPAIAATWGLSPNGPVVE